MSIAVGTGGPNAHPQSLQFFSALNSFLANEDQPFPRIDRAADLDRVKTSGRIGVLLGLQNAEHFRTADGVDLSMGWAPRVSQLTYTRQNLIGNGAAERRDEGLSDFAVAIVERMNKTGTAVDVSHCGDRTTRSKQAGVQFSSRTRTAARWCRGILDARRTRPSRRWPRREASWVLPVCACSSGQRSRPPSSISSITSIASSA